MMLAKEPKLSGPAMLASRVAQAMRQPHVRGFMSPTARDRQNVVKASISAIYVLMTYLADALVTGIDIIHRYRCDEGPIYTRMSKGIVFLHGFGVTLLESIVLRPDGLGVSYRISTSTSEGFLAVREIPSTSVSAMFLTMCVTVRLKFASLLYVALRMMRSFVALPTEALSVKVFCSSALGANPRSIMRMHRTSFSRVVSGRGLLATAPRPLFVHFSTLVQGEVKPFPI